MNIINNPQIGIPSKEELDDFESVNEMNLPHDYRHFLFEYNGGKPVPNELVGTTIKIRDLLGFQNIDENTSVYYHITKYAGRLPLSTFPIATDYFGNLLIMSLHPEIYGHIYFWDHETEPLVQDGHDVSNTRFMAYSFEELLSKFQSN